MSRNDTTIREQLMAGLDDLERCLDGRMDEIQSLRSRIAELEGMLRDRDAEIHRVRTHETAAAHELDCKLDPEERVRFKSMADRIAELEAEVERLREIVERLPVTADGGRVTPGQAVFVNTDELDIESIDAMGVVEATIECDTFESGFDMGPDLGTDAWAATWTQPDSAGGVTHCWCDLGSCYSTREAAEAARKEANG